MASLNTRRLWVISWLFKFIPPSRGHDTKSRLLRWAGATVGQRCEITSSVRILGNFELALGDHCFLGHEALIFGAAGSSVVIEDYAKVGSRTILVTGSHRFSPDGVCIEKEGTWASVRICTGAAVSTASTILPGITVNRMAHVAAGSVVTKDVPEYCRVAGVPARVIRGFRESADSPNTQTAGEG